jgi:hypothetical protein
MWKICQEPRQKSKVITPDLQALTRQTTQRILACFIAGFGILIIGGKKEISPEAL